MLKNLVTLIVVALLLGGVTVGQEVLTNDSVVEMVTAGLPDDIVIAKIHSAHTNFDLSTPALAKLTEAKVSSAVVKAMIEPKPVDPGTPAAAAIPAPANPDDPMAPHDPGIYLMTVARDGGKKMVGIERAGSGHEKTANTWGHAFSYGIAKAKIKAEVPERQAATRSNQEKPEFYMYFPPNGNLGAADTITSPGQFSLISLEIKKDHRETAVAKIGFGTASAGTDEKRVFKFEADKIRPYAYRVTPSTGLKEGEYAFVAASSMGGTASGGSIVIFDFGVDLK